MSKETFLEEEYNFDFSLIGLISYLREYKLAYLLNKTFHLNLTQDPTGLDYFDKSTGKYLFFPFFKWENQDRQVKYVLVKNKIELIEESFPTDDMLLRTHKTQSYLLIPEQKRFHYFLIVKDTPNPERDLVEKLNRVEFVHYSATIDIHTLKSKHNLIL